MVELKPDELKPHVIGWDLGGAHLKAVKISAECLLVDAAIEPCPLWQGLSHLEQATEVILERFGLSNAANDTQREGCRHVVTMTGELCDLFSSRAEGVSRLIAAMAGKLTGQAGARTGTVSTLHFYAGGENLLTPSQALEKTGEVASANWRASAHLTARHKDKALFIDMGSTTTDVIPICDGALKARGSDDYGRLRNKELVYTGLVRTPLMSVAQYIAFRGAHVGVMAEHFATLADAYRLCGKLPSNADLHDAADGGEKSLSASARRIARMIGCDLEDAAMEEWKDLAGNFIECQTRHLMAACDHVLRNAFPQTEGAKETVEQIPFIGAGCGRFLVAEVARRMGHGYEDFSGLIGDTVIPTDPALREMAALCAPALAVAVLAGTPQGQDASSRG